MRMFLVIMQLKNKTVKDLMIYRKGGSELQYLIKKIEHEEVILQELETRTIRPFPKKYDVMTVKVTETQTSAPQNISYFYSFKARKCTPITKRR